MTNFMGFLFIKFRNSNGDEKEKSITGKKGKR
jgi:hypothetical protein